MTGQTIDAGSSRFAAVFVVRKFRLVWVLPAAPELAAYITRDGRDVKPDDRHQVFGRNVATYFSRDARQREVQGDDCRRFSFHVSQQDSSKWKFGEGLSGKPLNGSSGIRARCDRLILRKNFDECVSVVAEFSDGGEDWRRSEETSWVLGQCIATNNNPPAAISGHVGKQLRCMTGVSGGELDPTLTHARPAIVSLLEHQEDPSCCNSSDEHRWIVAKEELQALSCLAPGVCIPDSALPPPPARNFVPYVDAERLPLACIFDFNYDQGTHGGQEGRVRGWSKGGYLNGVAYSGVTRESEEQEPAYLSNVVNNVTNLAHDCNVQISCLEHLRCSLNNLSKDAPMISKRVKMLESFQEYIRAQEQVQLGVSFTGDGLSSEVFRSLNQGKMIIGQRLVMAWLHLLEDVTRSEQVNRGKITRSFGSKHDGRSE